MLNSIFPQKYHKEYLSANAVISILRFKKVILSFHFVDIFIYRLLVLFCINTLLFCRRGLIKRSRT